MISEPQSTQRVRIAREVHEKLLMARISQLILDVQELLMAPDGFLSGSPHRGVLKRSLTLRTYSAFSLIKEYLLVCVCLRPSAVNCAAEPVPIKYVEHYRAQTWKGNGI
jgi:hypothetical protein